MVAEGKLQLKGEIEAASKAEKLEWKPQEEQIDAFGNVVKIKVLCPLLCLALVASCKLRSVGLQPLACLCLCGGLYTSDCVASLWACSVDFDFLNIVPVLYLRRIA